jgi:hypothetical protein
MQKTMTFLVFMSVFIFAAGFLSGYFLERTGMLYAQSSIDELSNEVESMQLQQLFIAGEEVDCRLMASTMGSISYHLWDMVNRLKETSPDTQEFYDLKREADYLSIRAWISARTIREKCYSDILPILFVYSVNCPECDWQDQVLQTIKSRHEGVLVYAIDYYLDEDIVRLIRDAYSIDSTPSMIINREAYGYMDTDELEGLVCGLIEC